MTFDPTSVEVTCVILPNDHCVKVPGEYINVCAFTDQFCKLPHTYYVLHIHTYIHDTYNIQNEWSHSLETKMHCHQLGPWNEWLRKLYQSQNKVCNSYYKSIISSHHSSSTFCWKQSRHSATCDSIMISIYSIYIIYTCCRLHRLTCRK